VVGKGSSNGVDTQRFSRKNLDPAILEEIKNTVSYNASLTYLLFVGRIVLDKGIIELIHVFIELHKKDPSLRLILAGQFEKSLDPLPADIENAIHHHPAIIHTGWTNKVEYYMAFSHFFVFPSYREGFPNVLLEAAVMQLPVICSRIAGNVDIISHKETGLLFDSQDETTLRRELQWALQNPAEISQMKEKLYEFIYHTFPREIFWEEMRKEYTKL
jgi:glycosyltransferase involved in cell wall biosynthesis